MTIKTIIKPIIYHLYRPLILRYLTRERTYRYHDIRLIIKPGVFHPGLFFSSKLLLKFLVNIEVANRRFLELGAGSGLISIFAARRGARVMASDISKIAVESIRHNARINQVDLTVIESDLFDKIPPQTFDIIVINPPYYPQNPIKESQYAWFCGEQFEYFHRLFPGMKNYLHADSQVIMVLSEDCDIPKIQQMATESGYAMTTAWKQKILWEENFIFDIYLQQAGS